MTPAELRQINERIAKLEYMLAVNVDRITALEDAVGPDFVASFRARNARRKREEQEATRARKERQAARRAARELAKAGAQ